MRSSPPRPRTNKCQRGDDASEEVVRRGFESLSAIRSDVEGEAMGIADVMVVSVPVSDQERAKEFYVEKLDLELVREDDSVPGIHWLQVAPRGSSTSLTLVTWFESMPPGSLRGLVLACDDLDRTYDALVEAGVEVDRELADQPWEKEAVIRDPDGNRLVLQQS
jgi:catechol 2,3-dioxygenase-like lactoylglutathione lyase family enzyme